jgi:hypothetical protein
MIKKAILVFLLTAPLSTFCQNNFVKDVLKKLDECIEKRSSFESEKKARIQNLEIHFFSKQNSLIEKYNLSAELYKEYRSYKYDSAYSFAGRMLQIAEKLKDKNRIAESKIALSFSCMSAGLYKEASEISSTINPAELQTKRQIDLYSFLSTLNLNMAYSTSEPYQSKYKVIALDYCKKDMTLMDPKSSDYLSAKMFEYQLKNDYKNALNIAEHYLSTNKHDLHNYAIITSTLASFYLARKDTAKAVLNLAAAAIADIQIATKETAAIRRLAELLYKQGDIQRAYSYATIALDDANYYNARQRKIEVGQILPIIEAGRFDIIKQQNNKLLIYSGLISILLILFLVSTFVILKQKKRLNSARLQILQQNTNLLQSNEQLTEVQKEIKRQNIDLAHTNKKLKEAQRIKEEYIGYFFSTNSIYLEKIEDYRKMVARKIRNRQFDELAQLSASSDLRKEREDMFALFDEIFIRLFPDFIFRYNQLFEEKNQVKTRSNAMLSPEIRIFALIRLGITESERIARFLDFSLSTVKNYKTKAKNRSLIPNELFEQKIMEIESVKTDI